MRGKNLKKILMNSKSFKNGESGSLTKNGKKRVECALNRQIIIEQPAFRT